MSKPLVNIEKSLEVVKLILSNMKDGQCDFHKLFKILYFAERAHLSIYGKLITGDRFVAMKNGPVPSVIYDIFKFLRGDSIFISEIDYSSIIRVVGKQEILLIDHNVNLEILSESELECIVQSIQENKDLSFAALTAKSHDLAWNRAEQNDTISLYDIAEAGGANEEMKHYIHFCFENVNLGIA